jgi:hypothetical protein
MTVDTCREQILQAVEAALAGITAIAGITVERERLDPVASDALPFLAVYDDGDTPGENFSGQRDYTLVVTVEGYSAGTTVLDGRQKADELKARVEAALYADVTLGGKALDLRPNAEPSPARMDWEVPADVGSFVAAFEIDFATSETDPFTFA